MSSPPFTRRAVLAVAALALCFAPFAAQAALTPDDQALQDRAVAYLEGLGDVGGRFEQVGPNGETAQGALYLSRPGRARFQYDPPSGLLMTSDGRTVVVSNSRLRTVQHVPLSATPLGLFLGAHIRLDKGVRVTAVTRGDGGFSITAQGVKGIGRGEVTLFFTDNPLRLTGWTITDVQHRQTRVTLLGLKAAGPFDPALFTQSEGISAVE